MSRLCHVPSPCQITFGVADGTLTSALLVTYHLTQKEGFLMDDSGKLLWQRRMPVRGMRR